MSYGAPPQPPAGYISPSQYSPHPGGHPAPYSPGYYAAPSYSFQQDYPPHPSYLAQYSQPPREAYGHRPPHEPYARHPHSPRDSYTHVDPPRYGCSVQNNNFIPVTRAEVPPIVSLGAQGQAPNDPIDNGTGDSLAPFDFSVGAGLDNVVQE